MTRGRRRPPPAARLKIERPEDLIAVVPYLLGFPPRESLVTVLVADRRVVLTARLDLSVAREDSDVGGYVLDLAHQHRASEVVLIAFSDDRPASEAVLGAMLGRLDGRLPVEALHAGPERWWSLTCTEGCCPAEGTPHDPGSHPLAAEAVYAGLGLRGSREELVESVAGPDTTEVAGLRDLARTVAGDLDPPEGRGTLDASVARLRAALARALAEPGRSTDQDAVRLALLVRDVAVRDVAWATITSEDADDHVRVWQAVVARTPAELAAPPLALLGMAAWISGNGALLNCCAERLSRVAPAYSMGSLLASIADRALPPSLWDTLARDIRQERPHPSGLVTGSQGLR